MKNNKKKVLILGASSDIGISLIEIYLKNNFEVLAHYNYGSKYFFNLTKKNRIKIFKFNFLTNLKKTEKFARRNIFKNCNVLINAAAQLKEIKYEKVTADDILNTMKINLFPGIIFTKILGAQMNKKKWGRVVHLSSIGVKFGGSEGNFCYSLSKHSLEYFPKSIQLWAKNDVLVNTVRVGLTNTKIHKKLPSKNMNKRIELIPVKRMATTKEISNLVYFLGSQKNTYISSQVISAAGGE
jgi:3-oxoacyl-[acyl-carrier protein] reductase